MLNSYPVTGYALRVIRGKLIFFSKPATRNREISLVSFLQNQRFYIKSKTYATKIIFLSILFRVVMVCWVGKGLKVCTKKWYYAQLSGRRPF